MVSDAKLRVLCLHGYRTSAAIFQRQVSRWDPSLLQLFDLTFFDGPHPARGKSDVEGILPGPYFEWFQFNKDFSELTDFDEAKEFIAKYMQEHGPFDGLMGFSQGGVLTAAFAALQQKGVPIPQHPPIRFIILISGSGFLNKQLMHEYYAEVVEVPSAHLIGDLDLFRIPGEELVTKFKDPLVIRHPGKHTVPRLGEEQTKLLKVFLLQFQSTTDTVAVETKCKDEGGKGLSEPATETECAKA